MNKRVYIILLSVGFGTRPLLASPDLAISSGTYAVEQRTGYFANGIPVNLSDGSATTRLHTGKEWLNLEGIGLYDNAARLHDPLLGRFTTSDALANKYEYLSPYTHCAANPINYLDPDGNQIVIYDGDRKYPIRITNDIVEIDEYGDMPYFVSTTLKCLNDIYYSQVGRTLLNYLQNSDQIISIKEGEKTFLCRANLNISFNAWCSNSDVEIIFSDGQKTIDAPDPYISLAHELFHAEDLISGNMNNNTWFIEKGEAIPYSEIYAVIGENYIRAASDYEIGIRVGYATVNIKDTVIRFTAEKGTLFNHGFYNGLFKYTAPVFKYLLQLRRR